METLLTFVLSVFSLLGALLSIYFLYIILEYLYYNIIIYKILMRELGFRLGTSGLPADDQRVYISALAIDSTADGGVFEQAGFRVGDLLPDETEASFIKLLQRHRGRTVELAVVDGGPGPPFRWRPRRVLRVAVPPGGRAGHSSISR
jgi:hypothetical protein